MFDDDGPWLAKERLHLVTRRHGRIECNSRFQNPLENDIKGGSEVNLDDLSVHAVPIRLLDCASTVP
jgi:hypothetical protein